SHGGQARTAVHVPSRPAKAIRRGWWKAEGPSAATEPGVFGRAPVLATGTVRFGGGQVHPAMRALDHRFDALAASRPARRCRLAGALGGGVARHQAHGQQPHQNDRNPEQKLAHGLSKTCSTKRLPAYASISRIRPASVYRTATR